MSDNKVKFGLSNVHVAPIIEDGETIKYGTPFAMPGAVALSAEPEGDSTPFYADNIKYYIAVANNGYSGDLELAITPKEFLKKVLGQTEDANGAMIENIGDTNARFALMGEIEGDSKKRRFVYYDCTATRPSAEMNTVEESKEPQTDTISITMAARASDGAIKAVIEPNEDNKAVYNTFFDSVYEKSATVSV